jgi:hypothetical protein
MRKLYVVLIAFMLFMPAASIVQAEEQEYLLISNESTDGFASQSSGSFQVNSLKNTAELGPYQMDVHKPFDESKIQHKLLSKQFSYKAAYKTGSKRAFWVTDFTDNRDYQIQATLLYSGTKSNIWVHNNQLTSSDARKLATEFDQVIHPSVRKHFASESDVDRDGKINILCFDIKDGYNGDNGFIGGYFYAGDLFDVPHSNESEIFYIDTYPLMGEDSEKQAENAYATLAHEFQHMVNFNQNVLIEDRERMDIWLDEALSMAAEHIYTGEALYDRIYYYNLSPSITDGHSLLNWNGDILSNYSLSYLFGQYVRVQANQGNSVFKEILLDSNSDYRSIENIAKKYIDPSLTFGKLMTQFRGALLLNNDFGEYGFKGESGFDDLEKKIYSGNSKNLQGGGALARIADFRSIPANKGKNVTYTFLKEESDQLQFDTTPPQAPSVQTVGDNQTVITGQAEAQSKIYVKQGNALIGTVKTKSDKTFSLSIPKQTAGTKLTIYAVDASDNKSLEVTTTVLDRTAPDKPSVSTIGDNQTTVSGKAEPKATVNVKKGTTTLGEATVSQSGSFTIDIKTKQAAGTSLTLCVIDSAGNKSKEVTVKVTDKTPPAKPKIETIGDHSTKISGTAESYSTIAVKKGTQTIGSTTTTSKGAFTVTLKAKEKAGTTLTINATDSAGNKSSTVTVKVADKTAPAKPTVLTVGDNQTTVTGKAEAGSKISVQSGKTVLGIATTNSKGSFTANIEKKQKAGTSLSIYATDLAGNKSSAATIKVADKTAPNKPIVNKVTSRSAYVTGKAEKGANVFVYKGNSYIGKATADSKGAFKIKIKAQKKGTHLIIFAKDAAGNKSNKRGVTVS